MLLDFFENIAYFTIKIIFQTNAFKKGYIPFTILIKFKRQRKPKWKNYSLFKSFLKKVKSSVIRKKYIKIDNLK